MKTSNSGVNAGGGTWTDSLLPGYAGDTSPQGTGSPLHAFVGGGALAAGDPVQSFDGQGNLFYMGNNFNRGTENGASGGTRNNTGSIWVATYAPSNPADTSTDGSKYVRTVILAHNTFGLGSFNDKTELVADPVTGNVYAAWSDFHGAGCNQILFSRSTDHGATFSPPLEPTVCKVAMRLLLTASCSRPNSSSCTARRQAGAPSIGR